VSFSSRTSSDSMHSSLIIATLITFDDRPFGRAVWIALANFVPLVFLVSAFSPLPSRSIIWLRRGAPILAPLWIVWINFTSLSKCFIGEGYSHHRYYLQLVIALYLVLAFGVGFSLDAIRSGDRFSRIIGWATGLLLLIEIVSIIWNNIGGILP
jgi:hypothetical protein